MKFAHFALITFAQYCTCIRVQNNFSAFSVNLKAFLARLVFFPAHFLFIFHKLRVCTAETRPVA